MFGEKLNLYPEESQDTILIYLYSCLGVCQSYSINKNLHSFASRGIIDKINLYLSASKKFIGRFETLLGNIVKKHF